MIDYSPLTIHYFRFMNDWNSFNNFFNKIYVLSVQSANERRKRFEERFQGMNYTFYFGADKNNFTAGQLIKDHIYSVQLTKKHHRYGKEMKPGEIACAWSHRMMYDDMISNNYQRAMIFEDDAVPDPQAMNNIDHILKEMPSDCELFFWGWDKNGETNMGTSIKQYWYHLQHAVGALKWDHKMISNLFAKPYSKHIRKAGFHDYTYAYSITLEGARKLVAMQQPLQYIADNLLSVAATRKILSAYIAYPPVFLHDALPDGTARDSYIR